MRARSRWPPASGSAAIPSSLPGPIRDTFVQEDRALRAEIIDTIEDNFYKPVDESKLDDASLKGIVESLDDPYSHYLTPEGGEASSTSTVSGQFEGVGMNVEQDKRGPEGAARVRRLARGQARASARAT